MDYQDTIEPVVTLKTRSAELIRKTREMGRPIILTQKGKATAVLQDIHSFQRQQKAFLMLKMLCQGDRDFQEGKIISHASAKRRLQRRLKDIEK